AVGVGQLALAVLLLQLIEFVLDDAPLFLLRLQDLLDLSRLALFFLQLFEDLLNLELSDLVDLRVENRLGLDFGQLEGFLQLLRGVRLAVRFADHFQGAIEGVEDDLKTFEDVDALAELSQLELEATPHGDEAEVEKMLQHLLEAEPLWPQLFPSA